MYFTTKFASVLLAVAASVQASVVARTELVELSVVFFDDVGLTGAAYSPDGLHQDVCFTLVDEWQDRAESVIISNGYLCTFYVHNGCAGTGTGLRGTVTHLPDSVYNNIESLSCHKD